MPFTFSPLPLQDALLIEPKVFGDARGWFMETYHHHAFSSAGISQTFVQDNHSFSMKHVLRGLHFQTLHTQAKLVRVSHGSLYDIIVDLRNNSSTYGKGYCIFLSGENNFQVYVPKGFAHGFFTLEDHTEFLYKCDDIYDPDHESGIHRTSDKVSWIGDSISDLVYRSLPSDEPLLAQKDTVLDLFEPSTSYF